MDYSSLIENYTKKFIDLRAYSVPSTANRDIQSKHENVFLNLTDENYKEYVFELDEAYSNFLDFFRDTFTSLDVSHHLTVKTIKKGRTRILWAFDTDKKVLFLFKRFGFPTIEDECYRVNLTRETKANKCLYVSLVESACESYNYSESKAQNDISLKEFFVSFWGKEEYIIFADQVKKLETVSKSCLDHKVVKTLTPNSIGSFKRFLLSYIWGTEFKSIIDNYNAAGKIPAKEINLLNNNFFDNEHYFAITSGTRFSESIITAEWLFNSVAEATSVDLTFIAMGYFKAFEQVLYDYIIQHSGEDRKIKKVYCTATKDKPDKIYLNETSIKRNWINTMLDSLLSFFEDNTDLFLPDISAETKEYIITVFDELKHLRNGYFHKDNISDSAIVVKTRETTFVALYYLFGALKFTDNEKLGFGIPLEKQDQYTLTYEYLCYHRQNIFYIEKSNETIVGTFNSDGSSPNSLHFNRFIGITADSSLIPLELIIGHCNSGSSFIEDYSLDLHEENIIICKGELTPVSEGLALSRTEETIFANGTFLIHGFDSDNY